MKTNKFLDPITSGEILRDDFMKPMGISINQLGRDLAVESYKKVSTPKRRKAPESQRTGTPSWRA